MHIHKRLRRIALLIPCLLMACAQHATKPTPPAPSEPKEVAGSVAFNFGVQPLLPNTSPALDVVAPPPFEGSEHMGEILAQTDGALDPQALEFAVKARACAIRSGMIEPESARLTVIDFGKPATQKRLFLVDLSTGKVLLTEWVAHGSGSGQLYATKFSNTPDSYQSSLGLIAPVMEYQASSGPAMRLRGLEKGINDEVYDRAIILHRAAYVGPGKQGRSHGCPAVRPEALRPVLNGLDGGLLYAYHPAQSPRLASALLQCRGTFASTRNPVCPATPFRAAGICASPLVDGFAGVPNIPWMALVSRV